MAISRAKQLFCRSFSSVASNPLRVCVMLKKHQGAEVDRLPTPYGLVPSFVAPDHPETKIVTNQFSRVAQNEQCSFIGNVSLGSSVSLSELREIYHVVVLAYGAENDRALGIPREDLSAIHLAREFVWWYNGHPDCQYWSPDLKSIYQLFLVRIIRRYLMSLTEFGAKMMCGMEIGLRYSDGTNDHQPSYDRKNWQQLIFPATLLAALEESSIRKVYLVGRRGPVQAACTAKELCEVLGMKDLHINIQEADLAKTPADEEELKNNLIQRRVYELLSKAAMSGPSHSYTESAGSGKQVAVGTGQFEDLECRLAPKSIGYKSIPVEGLPFDANKGVVPNIAGRVLLDSSGDHAQLEGVYVCGWLKRGKEDG
ncbi:pyridine nucleotide-disulfide oxidoreductase family protein [Actinidia rufa]|uniref:Pyridine nucleotide-disulfide oxidoreductase family protein n=1 Tax=Actinidia rufa TaxID=165716 RepID=A0A7J0E2W6_9ERIC|nr:pyridine nucleotide-disulfide oxidoreductase family protein [Actinidia rufa]